ncbi:MAG: mobile mystery protein B [Gammaproteobacteria bacterium]|nr:mobile mystery protein B [Gammaproteobacteria bacterium]
MRFSTPDGATQLGPDETVGLKFSHITTRDELNELEQANIQQGLLWLARQHGGDILSAEFIRELHRQMFGDVWEWAGTFRRHETNIGVEPSHIADRLHDLLEDARYWTQNNTYMPLEAAARFHHRMVAIHLFPNGNGRHARIAADTFLEYGFDHPPIEWEGGFDLQADPRGRAAYIDALRSADQGDYGSLLEFVGLHA